jgi:hypothetical protein
MTTDNAAPIASHDAEYPWFRDGSVPHSREDLVAEALALVALLFSLGIGLVIAMLPVSPKAAEPAVPSLEQSAFKIVPATVVSSVTVQ